MRGFVVSTVTYPILKLVFTIPMVDAILTNAMPINRLIILDLLNSHAPIKRHMLQSIDKPDRMTWLAHYSALENVPTPHFFLVNVIDLAKLNL